MYVVHLSDNSYHYVTRLSPDVTLCGRVAPVHSIAVAPVHGARLVTCQQCLHEAENEENDTRPIQVTDDG
jgi:hypothetical protein